MKLCNESYWWFIWTYWLYCIIGLRFIWSMFPLEPFRGCVHGLRNPINFAEVAVQLIKIDLLWFVCVNQVEYYLDIIVCECWIQAFQNLAEFSDIQFSAFIAIVGYKYLIQGEIFSIESVVQFLKSWFDSPFQLGWNTLLRIMERKLIWVLLYTH